jgi:hypothetical protein
VLLTAGADGWTGANRIAGELLVLMMQYTERGFTLERTWNPEPTPDRITDEQAAEETALSLCRHGTEPGDCLRLCVCGRTCDDHDHRRPGGCTA